MYKRIPSGVLLARLRLYSTCNPTKESLYGILNTFKAPISHCFGYGSGVFSQGVNQRKKNTQIDLIIAVEDSKAWHKTNIEQHPEHYSSLRYFGPGVVETVQRKLGAGVYFNPFCEINGHQVKYGIVELDDLCNDLENWQTLYLAGRLHKPVQVLKENSLVAASQRENLMAVTAVALLLLPRQFSEKELYMKIAGVSYMGDVRMALAENPNKVRNIVENQFPLFRKLYRPLLSQFPLDFNSSALEEPEVGPDAKGVAFEQSFGEDNRQKLLGSLPEKFRRRLGHDPSVKINAKVRGAVLTTVKKPSFTQSLKGVLTAGPGRSMSYSYEKLKKRWAS